MYVGVDGCVQMWERDDVSVSEWMEGGRDMDILCVWQHAFNWSECKETKSDRGGDKGHIKQKETCYEFEKAFVKINKKEEKDETKKIESSLCLRRNPW